MNKSSINQIIEKYTKEVLPPMTQPQLGKQGIFKNITKPLLSLRFMAELFDCIKKDGSPATNTILEWCRSGRLPPPDLRLSRKKMFWKPETINRFVDAGKKR